MEKRKNTDEGEGGGGEWDSGGVRIAEKKENSSIIKHALARLKRRAGEGGHDMRLGESALVCGIEKNQREGEKYIYAEKREGRPNSFKKVPHIASSDENATKSVRFRKKDIVDYGKRKKERRLDKICHEYVRPERN